MRNKEKIRLLNEDIRNLKGIVNRLLLDKYEHKEYEYIRNGETKTIIVEGVEVINKEIHLCKDLSTLQRPYNGFLQPLFYRDFKTKILLTDCVQVF